MSGNRYMLRAGKKRPFWTQNAGKTLRILSYDRIDGAVMARQDGEEDPQVWRIGLHTQRELEKMWRLAGESFPFTVRVIHFEPLTFKLQLIPEAETP